MHDTFVHVRVPPEVDVVCERLNDKDVGEYTAIETNVRTGQRDEDGCAARGIPDAFVLNRWSASLSITYDKQYARWGRRRLFHR